MRTYKIVISEQQRGRIEAALQQLDARDPPNESNDELSFLLQSFTELPNDYENNVRMFGESHARKMLHGFAL